MPNYKYKARDKFAKLISGTTAAENRDEAAKKLKDMGYILVSLSDVYEFPAIDILDKFKGIKLQELSNFTRQLYSMQKAGVPLLSSLEAIALQIKNRYFKLRVEQIASDIKSGLSFSDALNKHKKIFDSIYVGMIKAAETGGNLTEILLRLNELIEREIDTSSRLKAATRYPAIAFSALCLGFIIVITFVIPKFAALYTKFNAVLPLPTRILIGVNIAIHKYWILFILAAGMAIFAFYRLINSKPGRAAYDNFKLNMPVLGVLIQMLIMSRFARVTAILMKSGVPILQVLDLVANTSGNVIISRTIGNIKESVSQGKGISEPMKVSNLFPPMVIQMVAIGEQTGKVDELLLSVADYYDR